MKTCAKCKQSLPSDRFYLNRRMKSGLSSYCKKCNKIAAKSNYAPGKYTKSRAIAQKKAINRGYFRFGLGGFLSLKQSAARRGYDFSLTQESLFKWWTDTPDNCHYCGISAHQFQVLRDVVLSDKGGKSITKFKRLFRNPKHAKTRFLSIDRKDNEIGYRTDNMVKCCWFCNAIKADLIPYHLAREILPEIMSELIDAASIMGQ